MNSHLTRRTVGHWTQSWPGVVVFLLFGGFVLWIAVPMEVPPTSSDEVSEAIGHADSVRSLRGGVYFRLKEPNLSFVHHSKARNLGLVTSELTRPSHELIKVKYRNVEPTRPLFLSGDYYTVLAIRTSNRDILSEADIRNGSARDNLVGVVVGGVFLVLGFGRAACLLLR